MTRRLFFSFLVVGWFLVSSVPLAGQESQPDVDAVLQKYIQALGGKELLESVSTMKVATSGKGYNLDDENRFEFTNTLLVSRPRWVSIGDRARFGFDGTDRWNQFGGQEPSIHTEIRYHAIESDPVSYPLHLLSFPGKLTVAGRTKLADNSAVKVLAEPERPEPLDRIRQTPKEFYFDSETGLLLRIVFEAKTVDFSDYRDVEGIKIPFRQTSTFRFHDVATDYEITIDSIEINPELDAKLLEPQITAANK